MRKRLPSFTPIKWGCSMYSTYLCENKPPFHTYVRTNHHLIGVQQLYPFWVSLMKKTLPTLPILSGGLYAVCALSDSEQSHKLRYWRSISISIYFICHILKYLFIYFTGAAARARKGCCNNPWCELSESEHFSLGRVRHCTGHCAIRRITYLAELLCF